jgi:hypothetical protein
LVGIRPPNKRALAIKRNRRLMFVVMAQGRVLTGFFGFAGIRGVMHDIGILGAVPQGAIHQYQCQHCFGYKNARMPPQGSCLPSFNDHRLPVCLSTAGRGGCLKSV